MWNIVGETEGKGIGDAALTDGCRSLACEHMIEESIITTFEAGLCEDV